MVSSEVAEVTCIPFLEAVLQAMHHTRELDKFPKPMNVLGIALLKPAVAGERWELLFARSGIDNNYNDEYAQAQKTRLRNLLEKRLLQTLTQSEKTTVQSQLKRLINRDWSAMKAEAPAGTEQSMAQSVFAGFSPNWFAHTAGARVDLSVQSGLQKLIKRVRQEDHLDSDIRVALKKWLTLPQQQNNANLCEWFANLGSPDHSTPFPRLRITRVRYDIASRDEYVRQLYLRTTPPLAPMPLYKRAAQSILSEGELGQRPCVWFVPQQIDGVGDLDGATGHFVRLFAQADHGDKGLTVHICAGAKLAAELARRNQWRVRLGLAPFDPATELVVFGEVAWKGDATARTPASSKGVFVSPEGVAPRKVHYKSRRIHAPQPAGSSTIKAPVVPSCTSCQYQIVDMLGYGLAQQFPPQPPSGPQSDAQSAPNPPTTQSGHLNAAPAVDAGAEVAASAFQPPAPSASATVALGEPPADLVSDSEVAQGNLQIAHARRLCALAIGLHGARSHGRCRVCAVCVYCSFRTPAPCAQEVASPGRVPTSLLAFRSVT